MLLCSVLSQAHVNVSPWSASDQTKEQAQRAPALNALNAMVHIAQANGEECGNHLLVALPAVERENTQGSQGEGGFFFPLF